MAGLSKNNLLILAASAVIILLLLGWILYNYVYFANGQLTFGKVAARTGSTVLTEDDYTNYYAIYNGAKQCNSATKVTSTREEVTNDLVKVTQLQQDVANKHITVSKTDVEMEKSQEAILGGGYQNYLAKCGWTDAQFTKYVEIKLLKQKMGVS